MATHAEKKAPACVALPTASISGTLSSPITNEVLMITNEVLMITNEVLMITNEVLMITNEVLMITNEVLMTLAPWDLRVEVEQTAHVDLKRGLFSRC